jgi:hypothetical protein
MKSYENSVPRLAFGIAAVAMTAITIGVAIVMPAGMETDSQGPAMLAASKVIPSASTDVLTIASIDVVAVREPESSMIPCAPHPESQGRRPSKTIASASPGPHHATIQESPGSSVGAAFASIAGRSTVHGHARSC